MADPAPLIVTVALDAASFATFDDLRKRHFPRERNVIPAHLTLFHALPGEIADAVRRDLEDECRNQPLLDLAVTGLRSLGRGVAYTLESAPLTALRGRLATRWADRLTPQDRQKHQPHVTVQNKVDPAQARALLEELREGFTPFVAIGEGLDLWRYRNGPWEAVRRFEFAGAAGKPLPHAGEGRG